MTIGFVRTESERSRVVLWIVDGGIISIPVVARVEDFKEDSYIEITGADENHKWKSAPTRYEAVTHCKDCVHRDPEDHGCDCAGHEMLKGGFIPMPDNFYCADGERR